MKHLTAGSPSRFLLALIPAVLLCTRHNAGAAFIAGLDGVGGASTFSGQGITPLGAAGLLGWSDVLGAARFFEAGGDGSMIGTTPYDNYTVRYNPSSPVTLQPNTQYSLTYNMGYVAGLAGGNSGYEFSIGTMNGSIYTPVLSQTGTVPYPGNMHSASAAVSAVTLTYTTGSSVPAGNLAIQWAQTSTNTNASDFFGFNKVTLDAAAVPEPSSALFVAAGVTALALRRRKLQTGC